MTQNIEFHSSDAVAVAVAVAVVVGGTWTLSGGKSSHSLQAERWCEGCGRASGSRLPRGTSAGTAEAEQLVGGPLEGRRSSGAVVGGATTHLSADTQVGVGHKLCLLFGVAQLNVVGVGHADGHTREGQYHCQDLPGPG